MIDTLQRIISPPPAELDLHPTTRQLRTGKGLASTLSAHNKLRTSSIFAVQTFSCSICLEPQKGRSCLKLSRCNHVFCVSCLHSYFSLSIHEGTVQNVACPDAECAGEGHRIPNDELLAIVGQELFDRYAWLLVKQRVEKDPTITWCPRDRCQAAVERDPEEAYAKLRTCRTFCPSACLALDSQPGHF